MATPEGLDVKALSHDIIDAHGSGAAELAREKARTAILFGRIAQAKALAEGSRHDSRATGCEG
jgi:hypothetical protein